MTRHPYGFPVDARQGFIYQAVTGGLWFLALISSKQTTKAQKTYDVISNIPNSRTKSVSSATMNNNKKKDKITCSSLYVHAKLREQKQKKVKHNKQKQDRKKCLCLSVLLQLSFLKNYHLVKLLYTLSKPMAKNVTL